MTSIENTHFKKKGASGTPLQHLNHSWQQVLQYASLCEAWNGLISLDSEGGLSLTYPKLQSYQHSSTLPVVLQQKNGECISIRFYVDCNLIQSSLQTSVFLQSDFLKSSQNWFFFSPYFPVQAHKTESPILIFEWKKFWELKFTENEIALHFDESSSKFQLDEISKIKNIFHSISMSQDKIDTEEFQKNKKENFAKFKWEEQISQDGIPEKIKKIQTYMREGKCYLVNLTSQIDLGSENNFPSLQEFLQAWRKQPSRFAIWFRNRQLSIASLTPERFILIRDGWILTEPIKGTRKVNNPYETGEMSRDLWASDKEMFEQCMVVDLLRNDLQKVCISGSVQVFKPFEQRYSAGLLQMQSTIYGQLKHSSTIGDCISELLPGGSISGTPKQNACGYLAELETQSRGYYTGIFGIKHASFFDSRILIRTVFLENNRLYAGVGAGITTLSIPPEEEQEFKDKAASFLELFE